MDDAQSSSSTAIELNAEQRAFIDGLREMADALERFPEAIPAHTEYRAFIGTYNEFEGESALERLTRLAQGVGGRWSKSTDDDDFRLCREFGPHALTIFTARENVCERVVTGTRTVTVPDPDAEDTRPLVEVEEEIVEWLCPESLLSEAIS